MQYLDEPRLFYDLHPEFQDDEGLTTFIREDVLGLVNKTLTPREAASVIGRRATGRTVKATEETIRVFSLCGGQYWDVIQHRAVEQ